MPIGWSRLAARGPLAVMLRATCVWPGMTTETEGICPAPAAACGVLLALRPMIIAAPRTRIAMSASAPTMTHRLRLARSVTISVSEVRIEVSRFIIPL